MRPYISKSPAAQKHSPSQKNNGKNLAELLIINDQMKSIIGKSKNLIYKPLKNPNLSKITDTPFGDFPLKSPAKKSNNSSDNNTPKKLEESSKSNQNSPKKLEKEKDKKNATPNSNKKNSSPKAAAFEVRFIPPSDFRRVYDSGDFPFKVDYQGKRKLAWIKDPSFLDYHYYFPVVIDGLREKIDPYRFLSVSAAFEMIEKGTSEKIAAVIPQLILPIKTNLNTRDPEIITVNLQVLQTMIKTHPTIGEILVPYFRQLLPIMNLFKNKNVNLGDKIDFTQRKNNNIGDLIQETLEIFESFGGEDAYINIKYIIPTYESCLFN